MKWRRGVKTSTAAAHYAEVMYFGPHPAHERLLRRGGLNVTGRFFLFLFFFNHKNHVYSYKYLYFQYASCTFNVRLVLALHFCIDEWKPSFSFTSRYVSNSNRFSAAVEAPLRGRPSSTTCTHTHLDISIVISLTHHRQIISTQKCA